MNLFRDPLLHFLAIGAMLFGVFNLTGAEGETAPDEIVVTAGQIASLQAVFSRTWQRPPNAEELDSLVAEHIRDEVLYREAIGMGLDRDDAVIRRRLRQKMEFVANVMAEAEPTETELRTYVAERPDWFRAEPRFSFSHVYFRSDDESAPKPDLNGMLQALSDGSVDAAGAGNSFMPGAVFADLPRSDVDDVFGGSFAAALDGAPLGRWAGPVSSAYGMHFVHVSEYRDAYAPPFEQVREVARREWLNERRIAAADGLYRELRGRYVITVDEAAAASSDRVARAAP